MTARPNSPRPVAALRGAVLVCLLSSTAAATAREVEVALHAPPSPQDARAHALEWVAATNPANKAILEKVGALWAFGEQLPGTHELLERTIETFAAVDPATARFIEACRFESATLPPPSLQSLDLPGAADFYTTNLEAWYGRYLAQRHMYDEALEVLSRVELRHAVDPAGCLFYRAVCEHALLMKEPGLQTLDRLLTKTANVPVRYHTVATLMRYDLEALEEKSLDEVARKMSDVERRLRLGRGGERVQKVEEEIIANLDEIIKKLEAKAGGGGGGGGSGNQNDGMTPAGDSVVKGSTAPGEVDEKDIGNKSGWGDLPPKEQVKAKNLIDRMYPAHYIRAIEEYNRRLATRRAEPADR